MAIWNPTVSGANDKSEDVPSGSMADGVFFGKYDGTTGVDAQGLRYTAAPSDLPGATINAARLDFEALGLSAGVDPTLVSVRIYGELTVNPGAWAPVTHLPSTAARTTAFVDWTLTTWPSSGTISSPDLSAIVAELIAQPGFAAGQAIALLIIDNGTAGPNEAMGADNATALIVTYTPAGGGTAKQQSATVVDGRTRAARRRRRGATVHVVRPLARWPAQMDASLAATGSLSAGLTTQIPLEAAVSGTASLVASLGAGIPLDAALVATAAVGAQLSTAITLSAAMAGSATLVADLSTNPRVKPLVKVVGDRRGRRLNAKRPGRREVVLQAVGYQSGTVATAVDASLTGTGTLSASLSTGIRLTSALTASATLSAPLTTSIPLASTMSATATLSASLTTQIPLVAAMTGTASLAAELAALGTSLGAVLAGTGSLAGALGTGIRLAAALAGAGSVQASLATAIRLNAALTGSATVTAALLTAIRMAAALGGEATLVATLFGAVIVPEPPFLALLIDIDGNPIMPQRLVIKRGSLARLRTQLSASSGLDDLTGYTVRMHMRRQGRKTTLVDALAVVESPATDLIVHYDLQTADSDQAKATYIVEWWLFGPSATGPVKAPGEDYIELEIEDDIDALP